MLNRWVEDGLLDTLEEEGIGSIVFSPLAQGQLTDRYLNGIPRGARATKTERVWLTPEDVKQNLPKIRKLNELAGQRGQITGTDGDCLGAAQAAGHLGADRCEQRHATGNEPGRAE